jgi:hypothetical protein
MLYTHTSSSCVRGLGEREMGQSIGISIFLDTARAEHWDHDRRLMHLKRLCIRRIYGMDEMGIY